MLDLLPLSLSSKLSPGVKWKLPFIFSSNKVSPIGLSIYGFKPNANSPMYLAPSSMSKISFSSLVLFDVAFIIFPSLNSNLILLNKIPLDAYEPMRNKVEKDIDNIGKNKEIESNDIITLKQAYEAFKLYNKFQKIKQRAEEVDSEYIQNFLFENLLFAFSTYYRNKKYFGGVIADIQYYFWKMICNVLKSTYPNGMEFIEYSLLKDPQDKLIEKGRIIENIIKDENFKEKIKVHILNNKSNKHFEITEGLNYASNDLFLALNNTTINIIGNKENNKWKLDITITDRYDFTDFKEIDEYCDDNILKGLLGSTANNMAMISVASGVMHEYNVTIKFQIDWDDENE